MALPLDLSRHELTIRGTLPTDRIDTIVETIVMPLMKRTAAADHTRSHTLQTPSLTSA